MEGAESNYCIYSARKELFLRDQGIILQEMENQVKSGRARSIGLSNFNEEQISLIWDNAQIKPSNLQVICRFGCDLFHYRFVLSLVCEYIRHVLCCI